MYIVCLHVSNTIIEYSSSKYIGNVIWVYIMYSDALYSEMNLTLYRSASLSELKFGILRVNGFFVGIKVFHTNLNSSQTLQSKLVTPLTRDDAWKLNFV